MLTKQEALVEIDSQGRAHPDRLSRKKHAHYEAYAKACLRVYGEGLGKTRRELHREIDQVFAGLDDCPQRRIAAFRKLLDDVSTYHSDSSRAAAKLRQQVWTLAAQKHPLVIQPEGIFTNTEASTKEWIANQLGRPWESIDQDLFADVIEFQRLKSFEGYPEPMDLLSRYNVAQTQAALYRAESLTIWAQQDFKEILRYAKLARLMHSIQRLPDERYCIRVDGPSSILRPSTRYGVAMAKFLPGLISCRQWTAVAKLRLSYGGRARLEMSHQEGLRSPVVSPTEFDSELESDFASRWEKEETHGWMLKREGELLHNGQTVFTPDFTLTHTDGRRVFLEILGYWTPEYLAAKSAVIELFKAQPILLAVAEQQRASLQAIDFPSPAGEPIYFKKNLKPEAVLTRLVESSIS